MVALSAATAGQSRIRRVYAFDAEGPEEGSAGDYPALAELDRGNGPAFDAELDCAVRDADELGGIFHCQSG